MERLERRRLFVADLLADQSGEPPESSPAAIFGSQSLVAEGEAAPDLVAFAKALTQQGVKLFGADWHVDTVRQRQIFEDGAEYLNYIEVSNGDRTLTDFASNEGISTVPTWDIPGTGRVETFLSLEQLASMSGVNIPMSSVPSIAPIADQFVLTGSPLHIPIDGYDPNGNPIRYTVTSSNPNFVSASLMETNQTVRMSTDSGDMVFQLFVDEAPRAANRFLELAQRGFYNTQGSNEMTFHRVVDGFVIQGGDPTGTGTGGSNLGNFDDQFDLDLQHNRSGVLSYAKSSDDTNNSQFFVTANATRGLDSNHSVFGQLVEGDFARKAIQRTAVNTSERPINTAFIRSVTPVRDRENGLLRLTARGAAGSQATITVTGTDSEGNSTSRQFVVTVENDTFNNSPFLNDIPTIRQASGGSIRLQLTAQDVENDPATYIFQLPGEDVAYVAENGLIELNTSPSYVGEFDLYVAVQRVAGATEEVPQDVQAVRVRVGPQLTLSAASANLVEGGSSTLVTLTREFADVTQSLTVSIGLGGSTQISSDASVTIPAGQASVTFAVSAVDDTAVDSMQRATITAQAAGLLSGTLVVEVNDNDSPNAWFNSSSSTDTNGDGLLSPIDALVIINQINRIGIGALPYARGLPRFFYDTNNDFQISPIDILLVINAINRQSAGEGESSPTPSIGSWNDQAVDSALSLWLEEELERTAID